MKIFLIRFLRQRSTVTLFTLCAAVSSCTGGKNTDSATSGFFIQPGDDVTVDLRSANQAYAYDDADSNILSVDTSWSATEVLNLKPYVPTDKSTFVLPKFVTQKRPFVVSYKMPQINDALIDVIFTGEKIARPTFATTLAYQLLVDYQELPLQAIKPASFRNLVKFIEARIDQVGKEAERFQPYSLPFETVMRFYKNSLAFRQDFLDLIKSEFNMQFVPEGQTLSLIQGQDLNPAAVAAPTALPSTDAFGVSQLQYRDASGSRLKAPWNHENSLPLLNARIPGFVYPQGPNPLSAKEGQTHVTPVQALDYDEDFMDAVWVIRSRPRQIDKDQPQVFSETVQLASGGTDEIDNHSFSPNYSAATTPALRSALGVADPDAMEDVYYVLSDGSMRVAFEWNYRIDDVNRAPVFKNVLMDLVRDTYGQESVPHSLTLSDRDRSLNLLFSHTKYRPAYCKPQDTQREIIPINSRLSTKNELGTIDDQAYLQQLTQGPWNCIFYAYDLDLDEDPIGANEAIDGLSVNIDPNSIPQNLVYEIESVKKLKNNSELSTEDCGARTCFAVNVSITIDNTVKVVATEQASQNFSYGISVNDRPSNPVSGLTDRLVMSRLVKFTPKKPKPIYFGSNAGFESDPQGGFLLDSDQGSGQSNQPYTLEQILRMSVGPNDPVPPETSRGFDAIPQSGFGYWVQGTSRFFVQPKEPLRSGPQTVTTGVTPLWNDLAPMTAQRAYSQPFIYDSSCSSTDANALNLKSDPNNPNSPVALSHLNGQVVEINFFDEDNIDLAPSETPDPVYWSQAADPLMSSDIIAVNQAYSGTVQNFKSLALMDGLKFDQGFMSLTPVEIFYDKVMETGKPAIRRKLVFHRARFAWKPEPKSDQVYGSDLTFKTELNLPVVLGNTGRYSGNPSDKIGDTWSPQDRTKMGLTLAANKRDSRPCLGTSSPTNAFPNPAILNSNTSAVFTGITTVVDHDRALANAARSVSNPPSTAFTQISQVVEGGKLLSVQPDHILRWAPYVIDCSGGQNTTTFSGRYGLFIERRNRMEVLSTVGLNEPNRHCLATTAISSQAGKNISLALWSRVSGSTETSFSANHTTYTIPGDATRVAFAYEGVAPVVPQGFTAQTLPASLDAIQGKIGYSLDLIPDLFRLTGAGTATSLAGLFFIPEVRDTVGFQSNWNNSSTLFSTAPMPLSASTPLLLQLPTGRQRLEYFDYNAPLSRYTAEISGTESDVLIYQNGQDLSVYVKNISRATPYNVRFRATDNSLGSLNLFGPNSTPDRDIFDTVAYTIPPFTSAPTHTPAFVRPGTTTSCSNSILGAGSPTVSKNPLTQAACELQMTFDASKDAGKTFTTKITATENTDASLFPGTTFVSILGNTNRLPASLDANLNVIVVEENRSPYFSRFTSAFGSATASGNAWGLSFPTVTTRNALASHIGANDVLISPVGPNNALQEDRWFDLLEGTSTTFSIPASDPNIGATTSLRNLTLNRPNSVILISGTNCDTARRIDANSTNRLFGTSTLSVPTLQLAVPTSGDPSGTFTYQWTPGDQEAFDLSTPCGFLVPFVVSDGGASQVGGGNLLSGDPTTFTQPPIRRTAWVWTKLKVRNNLPSVVARAGASTSALTELFAEAGTTTSFTIEANDINDQAGGNRPEFVSIVGENGAPSVSLASTLDSGTSKTLRTFTLSTTPQLTDLGKTYNYTLTLRDPGDPSLGYAENPGTNNLAQISPAGGNFSLNFQLTITGKISWLSPVPDATGTSIRQVQAGTPLSIPLGVRPTRPTELNQEMFIGHYATNRPSTQTTAAQRGIFSPVVAASPQSLELAQHQLIFPTSGANIGRLDYPLVALPFNSGNCIMSGFVQDVNSLHTFTGHLAYRLGIPARCQSAGLSAGCVNYCEIRSLPNTIQQTVSLRSRTLGTNLIGLTSVPNVPAQITEGAPLNFPFTLNTNGGPVQVTVRRNGCVISQQEIQPSVSGAFPWDYGDEINSRMGGRNVSCAWYPNGTPLSLPLPTVGTQGSFAAGSNASDLYSPGRLRYEFTFSSGPSTPITRTFETRVTQGVLEWVNDVQTADGNPLMEWRFPANASPNAPEILVSASGSLGIMRLLSSGIKESILLNSSACPLRAGDMGRIYVVYGNASDLQPTKILLGGRTGLFPNSLNPAPLNDLGQFLTPPAVTYCRFLWNSANSRYDYGVPDNTSTVSIINESVTNGTSWVENNVGHGPLFISQLSGGGFVASSAGSAISLRALSTTPTTTGKFAVGLTAQNPSNNSGDLYVTWNDGVVRTHRVTTRDYLVHNETSLASVCPVNGAGNLTILDTMRIQLETTALAIAPNGDAYVLRYSLPNPAGCKAILLGSASLTRLEPNDRALAYSSAQGRLFGFFKGMDRNTRLFSLRWDEDLGTDDLFPLTTMTNMAESDETVAGKRPFIDAGLFVRFFRSVQSTGRLTTDILY